MGELRDRTDSWLKEYHNISTGGNFETFQLVRDLGIRISNLEEYIKKQAQSDIDKGVRILELERELRRK